MIILSNIIRIALITLLCTTPWLFGGVWARVQWVLLLVTAILLAMDLVARFGDEDRPNLVPSAWLPVLLGIALGLFQLIPWPMSLAETLAPGTVAWRTAYASDTAVETVPADLPTQSLPAPDELNAGSVERTTRSVYPVATREYLALLTLAMGVFLLASTHLVDRQSIVGIFAALAGCGALLAFFGLVQRLSWNGKFYWVFEPMYGTFQSFGPFVNRNNAGGFLNLCLAAGLGYLVWTHWNEKTSTEWRSGSSSRRRRRSRRSHEARSERDASVSRGHADPPMESRAQSTLDPHSSSRSDTSAGNPPDSSRPTSATPDEALYEAFKRSQESSSASDELIHQRPAAPGRETSGTEPSDTEPSDTPRPSSSRRSRLRNERRSPYGDSPASVGARRSAGEWVTSYLADLNARKLSAVMLVVFTAGGVLSSASRGSILAMFAAAMMTIVALAIHRGNRGYAAGLVAILVLGVGLMSWAGQTDFVKARFETMFEDDAYQRGRIPNWMDALQTVAGFRIAGTGLGTYRFVYEQHQARFLPGVVHMHAENQFIQSLVEGGVIALSLLTVTIVLCALAVIQLYRAGGRVNTALAITGTFALASQFVGGLFDFGLYIPSNMMVMAAISGIVIGRAALLTVWSRSALEKLDTATRRSGYDVPMMESFSLSDDAVGVTDERRTVAGSSRRYRSRSSRSSSNRGWRRVGIALHSPAVVVSSIVGFVMLGCLFGSLEMSRAGKLESVLRTARQDDFAGSANDPDARLTPAQLNAARAQLAALLPLRWDDAEAHLELAKVLMKQYRYATYEQLLSQPLDREGARASDTETSATEDESELDEELWSRATVFQLHAAVRRLQRQGAENEIARVVSQPAVSEYLLRCVRHLRVARDAAPTIPEVHYMLAELSAIVNTRSEETVHLERAQTLAPGNATIWFWSGMLDANSGRIEQTCEAWRKSLKLSPLHVSDIMKASQGTLTIKQLLNEVLPDQADLLLRVAVQFFSDEDRLKYRPYFLSKARDALGQTALPPDELAYTTAAIMRLSGEEEAAKPYYEAAISRNSQQLGWRAEYVRMLMDLRDYEQAQKHASFLVQANPRSRYYERLLKQAVQKKLREKPAAD